MVPNSSQPCQFTKGGSLLWDTGEPCSVLTGQNSEDSDFAEVFLCLPGVTPGKIEDWNYLATNLGGNGFPMAERLPVALSTTCKHLDSSGIASAFEAIEKDERQT